MALCRSFLQQTTTVHKCGSIVALGGSGFDRGAASRRYATQINYRFRSVKVTLLVDCSTGAFLDVHCPSIKPHDAKIGWQVRVEI